MHKRINFWVIGYGNHWDLHNRCMYQGMKSYSHQKVHIPYDTKHFIGQIFMPDNKNSVFKSFFNFIDYIHIFTVMKRDQDDFHMIFLNKSVHGNTELIDEFAVHLSFSYGESNCCLPVSYTHLTLPTNR